MGHHGPRFALTAWKLVLVSGNSEASGMVGLYTVWYGIRYVRKIMTRGRRSTVRIARV